MVLSDQATQLGAGKLVEGRPSPTMTSERARLYSPPMSDAFTLHPRLAADTIALGDWPLCRLLLMNDASLPLDDTGAGAAGVSGRSMAFSPRSAQS